MNFKEILDQINHWKDIDDWDQRDMDRFCKAFAGQSYPIILEHTCLAAYLSYFKWELLEDLEYYVYEAKNMKGKATVKKDWIEYDFKKDNEVIKYLKKYHS